jgi:hypothetical protein
MPLAQLTCKCITAGTGHIDVGDHDVRSEQAADIQRVIAAQRDMDFVSILAQYEREDVRQVAFVIRNDDAQRSARGAAANAGCDDAKQSLRRQCEAPVFPRLTLVHR